jgi:hypothetical protein
MALRLWYDTVWYDMIYLLTAIGLTPGGISTVHIYTKTIHRTTIYLRTFLIFCINFLFLSGWMLVEYLKMVDKTHKIISHRKVLIIFILYFWNNTIKYCDNQYHIRLVKNTEFLISRDNLPEMFQFPNYGGLFLAEFLNWAWGVCLANSINIGRPNDITHANIGYCAGQR